MVNSDRLSSKKEVNLNKIEEKEDKELIKNGENMPRVRGHLRKTGYRPVRVRPHIRHISKIKRRRTIRWKIWR